MTLPYTGAAKRGILIVALIVASSTELLAQGTSPWLQAIDVLQTAFTGPIARGLSLIAIVVGGLMFAFGEGGSKKALAGIVFGLGMAMGAANFLAWLFLMERGKAWRGYPALSKPLTLMGVERRWFLLSATFGACHVERHQLHCDRRVDLRRFVWRRILGLEARPQPA